jgi:hypothetical protein
VIARTMLVLLLLCGVARAQDGNVVPDPDDEPPPEAALATPCEPPAPVASSRKRAGAPVVGFGILPGYRRLLGSDWIGTSAELSYGGEAPSGFSVQVRLGLFAGASTFRVPFQDWSVAVVFVIPTGTRLRIDLGQTFGLFVVEEPHTADGYAISPTLGAFVAPTIDLWTRETQRLYLEARLSYDWIPPQTGDGNALTAQLGLGIAF